MAIVYILICYMTEVLSRKGRAHLFYFVIFCNFDLSLYFPFFFFSDYLLIDPGSVLNLVRFLTFYYLLWECY